MQTIFKKYSLPVLVLTFLAMPLFAHAQIIPFTDYCQQYANLLPDGTGGRVYDACTLLQDIRDIIFVIGMSLAVLIIIVGGIMYMTAQDDESKVAKAKKTIIAGIIGFVIILLASVIIGFVNEVVVERFG